MPTVLINGTVLSGHSCLPGHGLYIDDKGNIGDVFTMERYPEKIFPSSARIIDVQGDFMAPGFIDTHIHGTGGFGTEDNSPDSILGMSEALADFGVSGFLPTIYTDTLENMLAGIRAIVKAMGKEKGARILGINLEGPFISPERIGAQNPAGRKDADITVFKKLIAAGEGHIVCMTVAPELKGMHEIALEARKQGIVLLAGHTNATYDDIVEGMQAGITHTTHLFNAMSPLHHRKPGVVGAVLAHPEMNCEIICDGVHVHKDLVRMLVHAKPVENIVMITDALKPTGLKSGELTANGVRCIFHGGVFVSQENPDLLLGSGLTLLKGVQNLDSWDIPLEVAVAMATTSPARIYSFEKTGSLLPENRADIVVFDKDFSLKGLFVGGVPVRDFFS
ncbi:N-acetylglucosamine-6-phosphate deacetylase [Parasphaerochaeta coccoides]|uniref:N-acetylglucosamine-6-phosphate deacetylase n=1 Tax=Parasphaerochaeta coccoides (strain ATCC BAA-1237 / DSM 17374 / SPN1) TaxID=760011 RepID=F4GM72_PARC1|nr:N-acetylglucosamine-6-phosphate deacetylase [Parasphaerochaeta coccoides]AEC03048.1 N-acetylglucosamine-6-phosphate deacetylase [Parasphaerochaeta coccoides DSM 17374]